MLACGSRVAEPPRVCEANESEWMRVGLSDFSFVEAPELAVLVTVACRRRIDYHYYYFFMSNGEINYGAYIFMCGHGCRSVLMPEDFIFVWVCIHTPSACCALPMGMLTSYSLLDQAYSSFCCTPIPGAGSSGQRTLRGGVIRHASGAGRGESPDQRGKLGATNSRLTGTSPLLCVQFKGFIDLKIAFSEIRRRSSRYVSFPTDLCERAESSLRLGEPHLYVNLPRDCRFLDSCFRSRCPHAA